MRVIDTARVWDVVTRLTSARQWNGAATAGAAARDPADRCIFGRWRRPELDLRRALRDELGS
jgi:hypothetical protein